MIYIGTCVLYDIYNMYILWGGPELIVKNGNVTGWGGEGGGWGVETRKTDEDGVIPHSIFL